MRSGPTLAGWLRLSGALLVLVAACAVLAREAVRGGAALLADPGWAPDDAVVAAAAGAGALVAGWLALGAVVAAVLLVRGGRVAPASRHVLPGVVLRATAVLLGVAVTAAVVPAAGATPPDPAWQVTAVAQSGPGPAAVVPAPGWRPTAPIPAPRVVAEPADPVLLSGVRHPRDERRLVTVRRGDTLWDLAARGLGPHASDAEIAAEWPRWYAANRAVLGPDPDLLLPGQQLVPPDG